MARARIRLEEQRGFDGGLNLSEEIVNLAKNETFDLQNVDIDKRGGFSLRRGTRPFINVATGLPLTQTPDSGYSYVDSTSVRHLLVARGGHVRRWDGAAWQDVLVNVGSGTTQFAEFNNLLYILRPGVTVPATWNGAGLATVLTTTVGNYNDNLQAPNFGNFPQCRTFAVWGEVMWAGGVVEATGTFNSRIRWSHPGQPQDWRTNDYIDISPDDEAGVIRAMVPLGDRLIVFKDKSVHAVSGAAPGGFSVHELTRQIGAATNAAVTKTESAIYFWDVDTGAWKYDGKEFTHIFQPLFSLIDDSKMNTAFSFQTILQFFRERLYVSLPMTAEPYSNTFITLVYDDNAGKNGAWTIHTMQPFGWWVHKASVSGGDERLLFGRSGFVFEMDVENYYYDMSIFGTEEPIEAWYTTRWFDADNRATRKRWKRPVFVMQGGSQQEMVVEVLRDYDPSKVVKSFNVATLLDPAEGIWDSDDWDDFQWAAETLLAGDKSVILRGSPLGNGTAIALRMKNVAPGQDWRLMGLTMKWIDKRLRN